MADAPHLLRAADIAAMAGLAKAHILNPGARRLNKSLGDATGLAGLGIHLIEVAPGDLTTELHRHHHEDEAVYVLEGRGTAVTGEAREEIGPGDFLGYRAGGAAHAIENTGEGPLRLLVMGQRLSHDVCDYPRLGKRLYRQAGLPWNLVDMDAIETPEGGRKV